MSEDEQAHWDEALKDFPEWAFFRRLDLTPDERRAHEEAQNDAEEFFVAFASEADSRSIASKDDVQSYSLTLDLEKRPQRWWQFWRR